MATNTYGLFPWSQDNLVDDMKLSMKRLLMVFSAFMTLVFFIAVIAYGAANGAANQMSGGMDVMSTVFTQQYLPTMNFPALTVCPIDQAGVVTAVSCGLQEGGQPGADCMAYYSKLTVRIEGVDLACVQYNNPTAGVPLQSSTTASRFITRTSVDNSKTADGQPLGTFAIIHAQNVTPALGLYNSFVATTGYMNLVLLRNSTTVFANRTTSTEFITSASKVPKKGYNDTQIVEVDLVYPEQVTYLTTQFGGAMFELYKGRFIVEAGGLAALLYFLHRIIMWVLVFPMHFMCRAPKAAQDQFKPDVQASAP